MDFNMKGSVLQEQGKLIQSQAQCRESLTEKNYASLPS